MRFCVLFAWSAAMVCGQMCPALRTLSLTTSVIGSLHSASCVLPDGTPEESLRLTVPRRGLLHLEIASRSPGFTVILRDSDGSKIASGTKFDQHVESGIYTVVANLSKPSQSGDYTLTSGFLPDPDDLCHSFPLLGLGTDVKYQLSDSSCLLPDGSRSESYRTTVFGSGTLTLRLNSTDFSPYLILRTEDGYEAATTDAAGGNEAVISLPVIGNQTYTVVVTGSALDSNGKFNLTTSFGPDEDLNCRVSGAFADTQHRDGSFDDASCSFHLPGRDDAALFKFYDVTVPAPGVAEFKLINTTFSGSLVITDSDGNTLADDHGSGEGGTPVIREQLPAGQYRLYVFSGDSPGGDYTLSYAAPAEDPSVCSVTPITGAQLVTGRLEAGLSCRRGGLMADAYRIVLPVAGQIDLGMSSGDFSTSLELRDLKDNLLVTGDQTTDASSSQITTRLPAGTYVAVAASTDLAGGYTVSYQVTPKAAPACGVPIPIPLNSGYVNFLGKENCIAANGRVTDLYSFSLTDPGMTALVMTSDTVEGVLSLADSKSNIIRWNRDGYIGSNPAIFQYLPAGFYQVQVRGVSPSSGTPSSGRYRLDVLDRSGPKPSFCTPGLLAIGASQTAALDYASCRYPDETFAKWYEFNLTDPAQVQLEMDSESFVPGIVVFDSKGNRIGAADASGTFTASFSASLSPGNYYAIAKASEGASANGSFIISLSAVNQLQN